MTMVYVPAGEFLMGSGAGEGLDDEHPQHAVYLDAFWIDKTEVTNAQYQKCVEAGACGEPYYANRTDLSAPGQPVVGVNWFQVEAYCKWAGARLPTEAEWEKAARGPDGRIYPWGNSKPDCTKLNYQGCVGRPKPVGSYPTGASPYGVLDMGGNVSEWVADWYAKDYYARSPDRSPQGPDSGDKRIYRGGSYERSGSEARSAGRLSIGPAWQMVWVGVRCISSNAP
jgi:formylglycine-generating enzyme required for sulfatase activity